MTSAYSVVSGESPVGMIRTDGELNPTIIDIGWALHGWARTFDVDIDECEGLMYFVEPTPIGVDLAMYLKTATLDTIRAHIDGLEDDQYFTFPMVEGRDDYMKYWDAVCEEVGNAVGIFEDQLYIE